MPRHRFSVAVTRSVRCARLVRAHGNAERAGGTCRNVCGRRNADNATPVGASVCATCHQDVHDEWKSGRHSKMIQPATAASVEGDFSRTRITLRGQPFQLRVGERRLLHHRIEHHRHTARAPRRIHARQPAHSALPDDDREGPDHRAHAQLGRAAARPGSTTWRSSGPTKTIARRCSSGTRTASGATSASRTTTTSPRRRPTRPPWSDFGTSCERCHGPGSAHVDRYRDGSRPDRRSRDRAGRRGSIRRPAAWSARSAIRCATSIAPDYRAGADYFDHFQPVLEYGPRKEIGSDVLGRRPSAPFFKRRARTVAERVLSSAAAPPAPAAITTRTCRTSTRTRSSGPASDALCIGCHKVDRQRGDIAHAAPGRQRGQFVRRVPHAADGAQHQGAHSRSLDEPAGA